MSGPAFGRPTWTLRRRQRRTGWKPTAGLRYSEGPLGSSGREQRPAFPRAPGRNVGRWGTGSGHLRATWEPDAPTCTIVFANETREISWLTPSPNMIHFGLTGFREKHYGGPTQTGVIATQVTSPRSSAGCERPAHSGSKVGVSPRRSSRSYSEWRPIRRRPAQSSRGPGAQPDRGIDP